VEGQLNHIMSLLGQMAEQKLGTVEVRQDVYDSYNAKVDAEHAAMVWTHPGMQTYYRNSRGRVVVNSPFRVVDFWTMTSSADLADYITDPDHRHPALAHGTPSGPRRLALVSRGVG
jgi:4-hydroxyacetophenone monooxygenase